MLKFKEIQDLQLENTSNSSRLIRTPEGRAIAHIPGWEYMIDPDYIGSNWIRNRCKPNSKIYLNSSTGNTSVNNILNIRDVNYFNSVANAHYRTTPDNKSKISKTAFTVFCVIATSTDPQITYPHWILRPDHITGDPDSLKNLPNFAASPTGSLLEVYSEITGANHQQEVANRICRFELKSSIRTNDKPSLVMLTFSTDNGYSAYQNGELLGNEPIFTEQAYELENFSNFRNIRGVFGMTGILNIDLSLQENIVYRKQLESFVMKKYDIK